MEDVYWPYDLDQSYITWLLSIVRLKDRSCNKSVIAAEFSMDQTRQINARAAAIKQHDLLPRSPAHLYRKASGKVCLILSVIRD